MSEEQENGVGTGKLFENEDIVVWDFRLAPGESTGSHTHDLPYFFRVLAGSTLAISDGDGEPLGDVPFEPGDTRSVTIDGDDLLSSKGVRVPRTHTAKNIGSTDYHEILIELKS